MRQWTVDTFVIAKGVTVTDTFEDEHAAMWFAVEVSLYQGEGNWPTVVAWNGHRNYPNAKPDVVWSCSSLRKVVQGVITYCNIHG